MCLNEKLINPIKRSKINNAIDFVAKNNEKGIIEKIILFGSCITEYCDNESDIDVCFVSSFNSSNDDFFNIYGGFSIAANNICDIFIYNKVNGKLKKEIDSKGVVIYEYKNGLVTNAAGQ